MITTTTIRDVAHTCEHLRNSDDRRGPVLNLSPVARLSDLTLIENPSGLDDDALGRVTYAPGASVSFSRRHLRWVGGTWTTTTMAHPSSGGAVGGNLVPHGVAERIEWTSSWDFRVFVRPLSRTLETPRFSHCTFRVEYPGGRGGFYPCVHPGS